MTDTRILDGMMQALNGNPLPKVGPRGAEMPVRVTDSTPFYARGEVEHTNKNFSDRVDLFHQDLTQARRERPRRGSCNNVRTVERHMDGQVWVRKETCPGPVHAVETTIPGAVRVDGRCLSCGTEIHRAGLLEGSG